MVEIEDEVCCLATSFVASSDKCCYRPWTARCGYALHMDARSLV